jgi:hypothetical protein
LAGIGVVAVVATIAAGYIVLPAAAWAFVRLLTSLLNASVWFASALGSGEDGWTIARSVARAAARSLITPRASAVIAVLVLLGAASLFGLQRLLGAEEERK